MLKKRLIMAVAETKACIHFLLLSLVLHKTLVFEVFTFTDRSMMRLVEWKKSLFTF